MNELLLRRRIVIINSTPALPYDARVEYISCTRGQYINTSITTGPDATSYKIEIDLTINSNTSTVRYYCYSATNNAINLYTSNGRFYNQGAYRAVTNGVRYTIIAETTETKRSVTIGQSTSTQSFSKDINDGKTIYILGGPSLTGANAYIHGFIIKKNDVDIFNAYPVRVGQVGYLYDTISGQLFGNNGSGSFTIGNDVN